MTELTGPTARRLRERNGWSLQVLANLSGINKAYLSEFETGNRQIASDAREHLRRILEQEDLPGPVGFTTPSIEIHDGKRRLVLKDGRGRVLDVPPVAHVSWTDAGGASYSMYLGER